MVQADLLSIQLLHDAGNEGISGGTYSGEVFFLTFLDSLYILEGYSSFGYLRSFTCSIEIFGESSEFLSH